MQNRDSTSNLQPVGICQRFISFIMSGLLARGSLKRVTTGDSLPHEPNEMLLTGSSRIKSDQHKETGIYPDQKKPNDHSSSEILVEFRHSNGLDHSSKKGKAVVSEGKAAGKRVAIREREEKNKRREKRVLQAEKLPPPPPEVAVDEYDTEMRPRRRIILTNINAKSDEFIRKKMEDLSRTTSFEKL